MDSRSFYTIFLSFFAGVFAASHTSFGVNFVFLIFLCIWPALYLKKHRLLFLFCILFFCLGAARMEFSKETIHPLDESIGKEVLVRGFIRNEPEFRENKQRFYLKPEGSADSILVSVPLYPKYEYGDVLEVKGIIELPENFETYPGGPKFDYVSYLSKDGVRYLMPRFSIRALGENQGNFVVSFLFALKREFMGNIGRLMPEPHSSLVSGILLGEKSSLPEELKENFRRAGLTHILVLSGSNVSLVAASLMNVFSFFPRGMSHFSGVLSIILFALMTGASATTVRASIMALVVILARRVGRGYDVSRALIIAGFFMLIHNPHILAFDIGFELSFLSTLALIYVSPMVSEKLAFITERLGLREIVSMTISTQAFIFPFMVYKMGEVSLISLVTNFLVLPFVPWSMFLGFATGLVGFLGHYPAMPFAIAGDVLLSWIIFVVSFFGELSFAAMRLSIGEPLVIIIYILYAWIIFRWHRRNFSLRSASSN